MRAGVPFCPIFLRALLGENEDEAVAHFRQKMEAADPERTGTRPAEVLVELLARLGRFPEGIRISEERLAEVSTAYLTCPNTRELCQMAGGRNCTPPGLLIAYAPQHRASVKPCATQQPPGGKIPLHTLQGFQKSRLWRNPRRKPLKSHTWVAISFLAILSPAFADCLLEERKDSMTDAILKAAACTNSDGFSLKVYRVRPGGPVWATFRLPETNLDVLGARAPMYRIDKNKPTELDPLKWMQGTLNDALIQLQPKWVNWRIFAGEGEGVPSRGALRDLMDGTSVVFRYFLFTGGFRETSLSLAGAKAAIASAIGVPQDADPVAAAKEKAFTDAVIDTSSKCMSASATEACLERARKCRAAANGDPAKLRACMQ